MANSFLEFRSSKLCHERQLLDTSLEVPVVLQFRRMIVAPFKSENGCEADGDFKPLEATDPRVSFSLPPVHHNQNGLNVTLRRARS